jgi:hypothetical protein
MANKIVSFVLRRRPNLKVNAVLDLLKEADASTRKIVPG